MKLEYLGQVMLEGRPCHRIRSWDVKLWANLDDVTPVRDWYIDARSLLPLQHIEAENLIEELRHERDRIAEAREKAEKEFEKDTSGCRLFSEYTRQMKLYGRWVKCWANRPLKFPPCRPPFRGCASRRHFCGLCRLKGWTVFFKNAF